MANNIAKAFLSSWNYPLSALESVLEAYATGFSELSSITCASTAPVP